MDVIQRVHHEADVQLTRTTRQQLAIRLGSQLGVKRQSVLSRLDRRLNHQRSKVRRQLDPLDHTSGRRTLGRFSRELQVCRVGRILDRTHQLLQILSQCRRITPRSLPQQSTLAVDHELAVRSIPHRVLDRVVDRIADPGELRSQCPLGFLHMSQPLLERVRTDVPVRLGMSQSLVDVVETDTLGLVVVADGLQTGDLSQERRSGQATENQDLVVPLQGPQTNRLPVSRIAADVRQQLAQLR